MENCIFCQIIERKMPSSIVYEDDEIMAFKDINPQAPVHLLILPKKHIPTIIDIQPEDQMLLGKIIIISKKLASESKVDSRGFRLVFNCNKDAGQAVYHIHLHLIGGRRMTWPPG
jgi:histidine triad (HIT) family protein